MIYLFINDLIFQSRIENELRNLDLIAHFFGSSDELKEIDSKKIASPRFAIFDLSSNNSLQSLKAFRERFPQIRTLGFFPHVNEELKQNALALGCSSVIPRFEFTKNLSDILQSK
jgi:hypothetical protein